MNRSPKTRRSVKRIEFFSSLSSYPSTLAYYYPPRASATYARAKILSLESSRIDENYKFHGVFHSLYTSNNSDTPSTNSHSSSHIFSRNKLNKTSTVCYTYITDTFQQPRPLATSKIGRLVQMMNTQKRTRQSN